MLNEREPETEIQIDSKTRRPTGRGPRRWIRGVVLASGIPRRIVWQTSSSRSESGKGRSISRNMPVRGE